ncbi:right-handed parallel beta-helix repeat-containing protein [Thalassotalea psychrophila]|uniref:Right-handed parallel beta-helix repeat-containing protein n=1 Tax=Thalassotalea psychrophila TaxID=3065647 RepID=A0ABY9TVK9_9GAMM|nr:right-handed parallel beta-helix repeat-containing protein [Colwelliaceae bacterium SQ149]
MFDKSLQRRRFLKFAGGSIASAATLPLVSHANSRQNSLLISTNQADYYVATNGNDAWSGTTAAPDNKQSDGPFASLAKARDAVRTLKKSRINQRQPSKNITVLIRGGLYQLDETVVFGVEDSGMAKATVTYAAYPNEKPVFSSGKKITNWQPLSDELPLLPQAAKGKVWQADISAEFSQGFTTLYDSKGRLQRARSTGFIPLKGGTKDSINVPDGIVKNWSNVEDIELIVRPHHAWIVNILPLKSVDANKGKATTKVVSTYAMNHLHFLKETDNAWFENIPEALNSPGNWVVNSQTGKVYLWPRGEKPSDDIVTPKLIELLRIEGQVDTHGPKDNPVKNLHFVGLTFMHGKRYNLENDDAGLQHDWDYLDKSNALVRLRGAEHCHIEHCHFSNSGSGAVRVDLHGQYNQISNNHIEYLGGAGVLLVGYGPGTKDVNHHNKVYNNHIHHIGEIYSHSAGIFVWQSGQNKVANNLIHHTHYCGMIISGCMSHFFDKTDLRELTRTIRWHEVPGNAPSGKVKGKSKRRFNRSKALPYLHSVDNMIENNEIHHAMMSMGDGNGIYIRGAGEGNVIRRNYVHHLIQPMQMQAAIRTDGGQTSTLITENIIYKCTSQGIILKVNNKAVNNIIADIIAPPRGYYLSLREGPSNEAAIKHNIFYSSSAKCQFINELPPDKAGKSEDRRGRKLARSKDADTDKNIYFCQSTPSIGEQFLAKQQANGVDKESLAADPVFMDIANADFRLHPLSPALSLGFTPIDMSKIGLQK